MFGGIKGGISKSEKPDTAFLEQMYGWQDRKTI
jgi:hypothetical protein